MNNVGLSLPNRGVLFGATTMDELYTLAERAESSGLFHSLWVGDGLIAKPRLEAIATLSALAGRTQRLVLGVCCMATFPLRNPILFACQWASLDVISNGRTLLAVCLGAPTGRGGSNFGAELSAMNVQGRSRVRRMEDAIDVVRKVWSGPAGTLVSFGTSPRSISSRSPYRSRVHCGSRVIRIPRSCRLSAIRSRSIVSRGWQTVGSAPLSLPRTSAVALVRFERRWNRLADSQRCRPRCT